MEPGSNDTKRRFFRKTGLARAQRSLDNPSPSPSMENAMVGLTMGTSSGSGNSSSLDENDMKMNRHPPRFMGAPPRRARSAERFDGMRIAFSGSGDLAVLSQYGDEMLHRQHHRSPQPLRNGNEIHMRHSPTTFPVPSPPPPYSAAVTQAPPSYRQAVAAMKKPTMSAQGQMRYSMPSRATQSLDLNLGSAGYNLRTVASNPLFINDSSNEVICTCSKCQAFQSQRPNDGTEYNDAVYMESQAFLMNEIMTDGMAFCSIM